MPDEPTEESPAGTAPPDPEPTDQDEAADADAATPADADAAATQADLTDQLQAVVDRLNKAGHEGLNALGLGIPNLMREWLSLLEAATTQAAVPVTQLEAILGSIRAQRESIQALRSQLAVFDQQLAALESALSPFAEWGQQWLRAQESVVRRVRDLGQSEPDE